MNQPAISTLPKPPVSSPAAPVRRWPVAQDGLTTRLGAVLGPSLRTTRCSLFAQIA